MLASRAETRTQCGHGGSGEASEQSCAPEVSSQPRASAEKAPARPGGSQLTVVPSPSPQALLPLLAERGLTPNLQTFCGLATGCHRPADGLQLLADMKVSGSRPGGGTHGANLGCSGRELGPPEAPGLCTRTAQWAWGQGECGRSSLRESGPW